MAIKTGDPPLRKSPIHKLSIFMQLL
jgi:hypothetical protein